MLANYKIVDGLFWLSMLCLIWIYVVLEMVRGCSYR